MKTILYALLALLLVYQCNACGAGGGTDGDDPPPEPEEPPPEEPPPEEPAPECDASKAEIDKLPEDYYKEKDGGPLEKIEDAALDAGSTDKMCWKNHKPKADELDYILLTDSSKMGKCGGEPPPAPSVAHLATEDEEGAALLHSCSIICTVGPPKVTVEGVKTDNVKFEICRADSFSDPPELLDCTEGKFGEAVEVGSEERPSIYDIVIKSEGFKKDDFIAIEKVNVEGEICPDDGGGGGGGCDLACDFEKDTCGFKTDKENSKVADPAIEFKKYQGKTIVGNLDTGVNALADAGESEPKVDETSFLAAPQNPKDVVVMSKEVEVTEDTELSFRVYEACAENSAKICVDDISNCPYESDPDVKVAEREWLKKKVKIPKGTKKIFLVAENKGENFCAGGFDDLDILDDSGKGKCGKGKSDGKEKEPEKEKRK